jgi:hypothetical protein
VPREPLADGAKEERTTTLEAPDMMTKLRSHLNNPAFMLLFVQGIVVLLAAMVAVLLPLQ